MGLPVSTLKPNILIAPLDWGLGHATRCIPIIHALLRKNCNVLIACEGDIRSLLLKEFPYLSFVQLKGYHIRYSKNSWTLPFQIAKQIPKILSTIQYENKRLAEIVKEHHVHGIISDNRYGFYHKSLPSVFITHQLRIKTGLVKWADDYFQKLNYRYINRFAECWVPDNEAKKNLAGELSHPKKRPSVPVKFLGPLSRFKRSAPKKANQLLILLSGPEPQRTVFENLLIQHLKGHKGLVDLVRGLPGETKELDISPNVSVYHHLSAQELGEKISKASTVISRCGYSTVMDLAVMGKQSILVPTPGQTEQEYLARHLMENNLAFCIEQKKFKLENALQLATHFPYKIGNFSCHNDLEAVLDSFLSSVYASAV